MTDMPLHDEERHVWRGHPSQLLNLSRFVLLAVAAAGATWLLFVGRGPMMRGVSVETGGAAIRAFPWVVASVWIIAALVALAVALRTASTKYELTTERLRVTDGLLSTTTEELELRRVRDFVVARSLLERLTGIGEVRLTTADATAPRLTLRGIRDPHAMQGKIRALVQALIQRYGVREIDVS